MWKDFFLYTRSEQKGIIILLILIFILLVVRFTMPHWSCYFVTKESNSDFVNRVKVLNEELKLANGKTSDSLFYFNPNKITKEELVHLGFSNYQLNSFIGYREKVGAFKSKEDLLKVYGVDSALYNRIEPYVHLTAGLSYSSSKEKLVRKEKEIEWINFNKVTQSFWLKQIQSSSYQNKIKEFVANNYIKKSLPLYKIEEYTDEELLIWLQKNSSPRYIKSKHNVIELNTASVEDLKSLTGIGDKLARRTIKYRNLLGGFYNKSQLKEVYGIDEDLYMNLESKLKVDISKVVAMNLAQNTVQEIAKHPYINYEQAKELKNFYRKNRTLKEDNLLSMVSLDVDDWSRIRPYLK